MLLYPFTAIVGQEDVKKALLLNLICPSIGGVLLAGEKGTAKSTIVRSLAQLVPGLRVVTLPLNATEDRVVGALHLEEALKSGRRAFEPGILAAAHENILYIDEVNLLSESLVNAILDVAASGVNVVEREGISHSHLSSFVLIGSMNPEEGELKPQLLDRFGLVVPVRGSTELEERKEIIRRRLAFEQAPAAFIEEYRGSEGHLREQIYRARECLKKVTVSAELLEIVAQINLEACVAGHRGDLVVTQAARALAALKGRDKVLLEDIKEVAPLVLFHRWRSPPVLPPLAEPLEQEPMESEQSLAAGEQQQSTQPMLPEKSPQEVPQEGEKPEPRFLRETGVLPDEVSEIGETFKVKEFLMHFLDYRTRRKGSGRRSKTRTMAKTGRYIKYRLPKGKVEDIALDAIAIHAGDIRQKVREKRVGNTILFVVDASGSMGARRRMVAVKGAILSLLQDAYQKRDTVGMMAFRGQDADLLLPPTRSIDLAYKLLRDLPVGGKTPLALGILRAAELIRALRVKDPDILPVIVLVSDGRANVALQGEDPVQDAQRVAQRVSVEKIQFVVVDTEAGPIRLGLAERICEALNGIYFKLEDLKAEELATALRSALN
jgi:magnesium chelatase subunit D